MTVPRLVALAKTYGPGLVFVGVVTFVGFVIHWNFETISPLVASLVLGVLIGNVISIPKIFVSGQKFAAKKVLRFGIVLLGTQLALKQVVDLGGRELIVVVGVVALTFLATSWTLAPTHDPNSCGSERPRTLRKSGNNTMAKLPHSVTSAIA